jgi:nucleoside-triphosphatase THEP1
LADTCSTWVVEPWSSIFRCWIEAKIRGETAKKGKKWAIVEQMKRGITWETHNLLSDPCARQFQLVFLRNNLLTYYDNESKAPAFQKVIDSLVSEGFLVIGAHENIPADVSELVHCPGHPCIFQKKALAHPTNNKQQTTDISRMERKCKNIFVAGPPRCGKSTLIEKLVRKIETPATGFFTREVREKGRRTGFTITTLDSKEGLLAHDKIKSWFKVGKYGVNLEDIDQIAVPSMIPTQRDEIVVVDEVGKMECCSPLFKKTLIEVLDSHHPVIGSIAQKGGKFIQRIKARDDVLLVRLNEKNRDDPTLFSQLLAALT